MRLVVIVDDDDEFRGLLREILGAEGWSALDYPGPQSALEALRSGVLQTEIQKGNYPIVLSDNLMPGGMSGLDFLRELHAHYPKLPTVFMTAYGSDQIFRQATKLGAVSYIRKPFSIQDLFDHLSKADHALDASQTTNEPRPA